jgi:hypothetical protein
MHLPWQVWVHQDLSKVMSILVWDLHYTFGRNVRKYVMVTNFIRIKKSE